MNFKSAVNKYTYTDNGALTFNTSGNANLDFFGMGGSLRNADNERIITLFRNAFSENPEYALRTLLYLRDIRLGGMGEKRIYRVILRDMLDSHVINLDNFSDITVKFGSWKDIFEICNDDEVAYIVKRELDKRVADKNYHGSLMEKYIYSVGGKDNKRAEKLAYFLGLTPRQYRKWISKARAEIKIVESKMCANDWDNINYENVPSKAMLNYSNAFRTHSPEKFKAYLDAVNKGEKKINASVLYPYEIVKKVLYNSEDTTLNTLWKSLKNYGCDGNAIVVCDTSGSMLSPDCMPLSVAISLAIYFAERNTGKFKGEMITFSDKPSFFEIPEGDIFSKIRTVQRASWGMNTNLQAVFDLLLNACIKDNVPEAEMPKRIIIVSDMEFDTACRGNNKTNFEAIKEKYANSGYTMPELVFWNVNSVNNNLPVRYNENGTALISGCSPSLFESIAKAEKLDPVKFMLDVIMQSKYDCALDLIYRK